MLEFCEITKVFNTDLLKKPFCALDKVSFRIPEGKIIGFLGANGAGKTTSIKIAMDFIRPTSGHIEYGLSLGGSKKEAFRKLGYLPERPYFYPHLTGRDFCYYMGSLADIPRKEIKEQIRKWASRFKIDFALDREIKNYSKGMLQRIGFLVTIIHDPKLIILDEPLSGIDPVGRKELKEIIKEVNEEGKTIFFSSHIVSDLEEISDHVVFLKNGQLKFEGAVSEIINNNSENKSIVEYVDLENITRKIEVDNKEKKRFLTKTLNNQYEIISVNPKKPSLEEIFYNVK